MHSRGTGSATGALLIALFLRTAHAQSAAPRGLSYQADAPCLDRAGFVAVVLERAARADLEPTDAQHAGILVALRASHDSFIGSVGIRRGDGDLYTRAVRAATCEEVSSAIAFILALALNGRYEAAADGPTASARPEATPEVPPATTPSAETGSGWGWAIGGTVGARRGIAPSWAMTEQIAIELRSTSRATWAPSFRIAGLHAQPVTRDDPVGTTEFSWIAARASGCPLQATLATGVELMPCVGLDLGAIGAAGRPASAQGLPRDTSTFWANAFGSLRLRFHLAGPLFGEIEPELILPFTPYDFAFDPRTPVYSVPTVAGAGSAGLFAQFP
jgi:hypothetical protein